jgi:hypothetical protein
VHFIVEEGAVVGDHEQERNAIAPSGPK